MITYIKLKCLSTSSATSHHTSLLKKTHKYAKISYSHFCVGRMSILLCLPNFCLFCTFILCVVICAFLCVKELLCLHHHLHHIQQLSNAFQPCFRYMVNLVVITTIVLDNLVQATLKGQPGMIDFVSQIIFICHTDHLYEFLFVFQGCIIETLDYSEKPKIQQVCVR